MKAGGEGADSFGVDLDGVQAGALVEQAVAAGAVNVPPTTT